MNENTNTSTNQNAPKTFDIRAKMLGAGLHAQDV